MATRKRRDIAGFKPSFADNDPTNVVEYTCTISNMTALELPIRFFSCGATLSIESRLIRETKL